MKHLRPETLSKHPGRRRRLQPQVSGPTRVRAAWFRSAVDTTITRIVQDCRLIDIVENNNVIVIYPQLRDGFAV